MIQIGQCQCSACLVDEVKMYNWLFLETSVLVSCLLYHCLVSFFPSSALHRCPHHPVCHFCDNNQLTVHDHLRITEHYIVYCIRGSIRQCLQHCCQWDDVRLQIHYSKTSCQAFHIFVITLHVYLHIFSGI